MSREKIREIGFRTVGAGSLEETVAGGSLVLDAKRITPLLKADQNEAIIHIKYFQERDIYSFTIYKKPQIQFT